VRLLLVALLLAAPLSAQRGNDQAGSWVTEIVGGAGADLFARGPWITPVIRRSSWRRVVFATALSLIYEYPIEMWNDQQNAGRLGDVGQRLVGTVLVELVDAALR